MSLENQEKINDYLRDELNKAEKAYFEQKLHEDKKLKEQLEASQLMVEAMQRKALKDDINQAKPKSKSTLWKGGLVLLAVIVVFLIWKQRSNADRPLNQSESLKINTQKETNFNEKQKNKPQLNSTLTLPNGDSLKELNDKTNNLSKAHNVSENQPNEQKIKTKKSQVFWINPNAKSQIVGKEGSKVTFPSKAFQTNADSIRIELLEYYDLMDMIVADLTTQTTEGDLLQTAGMININAYDENGNELTLAEEKQIEISMAEKLQATNKMTTYYGSSDDNVVSWERAIEEQEDSAPIRYYRTYGSRVYFKKADKLPLFKGGEEGLQKAIERYTRYDKSMQKESSSKIKVHYTVDKYGFVSWVSPISESTAWAVELAEKVMLSLPRYETVGEHEGEKSGVSFTREITLNPQLTDKYYSKSEWSNYYDSIAEVREQERKAAGAKERRSFIQQMQSDLEGEGIKSNYTIKSDRLGWINLDDPIYRDTRVIAVAIPENLKKTKVRLVHPTKNIIIAPIGNEFKKLPTDVRLNIFAIRKNGNKTEYAWKEWKVGKHFPKISFTDKLPNWIN